MLNALILTIRSVIPGANELLALLKEEHKVPDALKEAPAAEQFDFQTTETTRIYVAPYEAQQTSIAQFSNINEAYDAVYGANGEPTENMLEEDIETIETPFGEYITAAT